MLELSDEEVVDRFLDNIRYLKIAHHVNGRIRVKATWSGAKKLATSNTADLEDVISRIPGIVDYRVNKSALSIIINYDSETLPFELWEDVGSLNENPLNREDVKTRLLDIFSGAE